MKPQVCHTCGFSAQANTVLNQTGLILQGFGGVMRSNTAAMPCSQVSRALNCLTYAFHICRNCYAPKKRNLCRADIIAERNVPKARRSGAIVRWLSTGCLHARNRYAQAQTVKLNIFQKIVLFELLTIVFVSRQKIGNIIPKIFVVGRNIKMRERMRNKVCT